MKKVLIVMPEAFYGGAEKQFRYLVNGISKKQGIETYVCIEHSYHATLTEQSKEFLSNPEVHFTEMTGLNAKCSSLQKMKSVYKLAKKVKEIIKKQQINIVLGYGALFSAIIPFIQNKNTYIILGERCDGKYKNPITKKTTRKADMVICNSKAAMDYMLSVDYKNVTSIKNGIVIQGTFDHFAENERFQILVPARVLSNKNQLQVIKAVKLMKDVPYKVTFVGEIQDQSYYETCLNYVKENHMEDSVEFLGCVSNMRDYYEKTDLVILPSLYEGTPNVVLESFAYKRMCLASDIVMNRDVIRKDELLFALDDIKDTCDKIENVYHMDQATKTKIVNNNYDYVMKEYSVEQMVNEYETIFRSVEK